MIETTAWKRLLNAAYTTIVIGNVTGDSNGRHDNDPDFAKSTADMTSTITAKSGVAPAGTCGFQMPLHYPRYNKSDYETMEEWRIDSLLKEYGLADFQGNTLDEKRKFAIGTFLWPDQLDSD